MRGERGSADGLSGPASGSSPHARGTPEYNPKNRAWSRFIPACAGNAIDSGSVSGLVTVHPRMRGERVMMAARDSDRFGSSPHARGTHSIDTEEVFYARFIPACAGNAEGVL